MNTQYSTREHQYDAGLCLDCCVPQFLAVAEELHACPIVHRPTVRLVASWMNRLGTQKVSLKQLKTEYERVRAGRSAAQEIIGM